VKILAYFFVSKVSYLLVDLSNRIILEIRNQKIRNFAQFMRFSYMYLDSSLISESIDLLFFQNSCIDYVFS